VVAKPIGNTGEGEALSIKFGCLFNMTQCHGSTAKFYSTRCERPGHRTAVDSECAPKLTRRRTSLVASDGIINLGSSETVDRPMYPAGHWPRTRGR